MIEISIKEEKLDIIECLTLAEDVKSGGIATFIGSVRNITGDQTVIRLEYECYRAMAIKEMQKIAEQAIDLFSVRNIVVQHRIGILYPGDAAVIIVVSAGHRHAVFDACRYVIDTIKKTVPIWKKEIFENGAQWVSAHP